ncbi:MAG TPA: phosphopyruvate hydratase [Burkholderiaceae bacterium]|jgi:enolase|nr:phosphopyruvate hydratase [Burkholderiaceae bacterium]
MPQPAGQQDTRITHVRGRRVWDSRGRPTVEAEVTLGDGSVGRAIAPAGASRGSREALELRDGGTRLGGLDVGLAVAGMNGEIAALLHGRDAADQAGVDGALIACDGTPAKARLGGNAIVATSLAVLQAAATARGLPLWRHLAGDDPVSLPLPEIQIFGGGAHAGRRVDIQDFMVMPLGAASFAQALEMTAEVYAAAGALMQAAGKRQGVADEGGYWPAFAANDEALGMLVRAIEHAGLRPGTDMAISLDIAASEFGSNGRYRLALETRELDTAQLIDLLGGWLDAYPIVSIEDPLAEDDDAGMVEFTRRFGRRVQIIGDDYLVTAAARIEHAAALPACNCALIKPNQAGTVSETLSAMQAARRAGWSTVVSARSGETEDVAIAHLAVGWNAAQLKVGSFARSERMAKWNECLRIEEALGARAQFAGRAALAID